MKLLRHDARSVREYRHISRFIDVAPDRVGSNIAASCRLVVRNSGDHAGSLTKRPMPLPDGPELRDAVVMPDRPFPAVEALIRRVQRIAASRPDPMHILAQTISMTGAIGADPYAVLGVLIEGAVQTIVQQIPKEQRAETAATLVRLLTERLDAHGIASDDSE
jgi:hypothetical protein